MSNYKAIALIGKTRSGKDTAFRILNDLGYNVKRVAFGDYMKIKFHEMFPWIPKNPKPIDAYQQFNLLTKIDERVWVKPAIGDVYADIGMRDLYGLDPIVYVFTDIRQEHELKAVQELGATFVQITAPEGLRVARAQNLGETLTEKQLNATTELAMDNFNIEYDYKVHNNGDIEHLTEQLVNIIESIGGYKRREKEAD